MTDVYCPERMLWSGKNFPNDVNKSRILEEIFSKLNLQKRWRRKFNFQERIRQIFHELTEEELIRTNEV